MRPRRLQTCVLALLAAVSACGGDTGGEPGAAGESPSYGGTAVVAGPSDLGGLNPLVASARYAQEMSRYALFLPLLRYGPDLELEPALAREWELIGDTAVVFHLREDVHWHDGARTTAHDVLFTWERATDPETAFPNGDYFAGWEGAEVVDSFTIRFRFRRMADALAGLPFTPIAPRHLLDSVPPAQLRNAAFNRAPIGNGPFRFVEYEPNDRWVFEANPSFPEALGGRPYLDRLVWRVIPDGTAQATELQTGGADLALGLRSEDVAKLDARPELAAIVRESRQYAFVGWNTRRPPFGDARVRQAMTLAINRDDLIRALRAGYGAPALGAVGPYHWAFAEDLEPLPFSPDSARALLAAAGIFDTDGDEILERPDGTDFGLELDYAAGSGFQRDVAEMIRADLGELGIQVRTRPVEFGTILQRITTPARDFDAVIMGWESDFRLNLRDAFHSASLDGPYQFAGYSNPAIDSLIDRSMVLPDREQAKPLLHRLQRIMRDEQPWGFLYYYPDLYVARERLHGVRMDIRGAFVNLQEWWVAPSVPSDSAAHAPSPDPEPSR